MSGRRRVVTGTVPGHRSQGGSRIPRRRAPTLYFATFSKNNMTLRIFYHMEWVPVNPGVEKREGDLTSQSWGSTNISKWVNLCLSRLHYLGLIITVRNSSCGEVMFSQARILSTGGGESASGSREGACLWVWRCTLPLWQTHTLARHTPQSDPLRQTPWATPHPRRPLQRKVRILLEYILVVFVDSQDVEA